MFGDMFRKFSCWSFGNSMSLRFKDGDATDDDAATLAIKEAEEADRKKQEEFDKARQRADQEAANAQKARELAAQASRQLVEMQTQSKVMEAELEALRAKIGSQGIDLKEEDFSDSDVALVKAIKNLETRLEAKDAESRKKIAELEKLKDNLLAERKEAEVEKARNKVYEGLLSDLDEEYGHQFRNAAVKQFDKLLKEGKVPTGDPARATRVLEKCYKDAKTAGKATTKDSDKLSLDTGAGGGAPNLNRIKLKPGSLEEVSAQIRAANTG